MSRKIEHRTVHEDYRDYDEDEFTWSRILTVVSVVGIAVALIVLFY